MSKKALLLATLVLAGTTALGQTTTATLSGSVQDASGAVITDAKVSARNTQTGATRAVVTGGDGRYGFINLEPGQYELRAERAGFKTAMESSLVLTVGGAAVVDLTMQVGNVSE